ncbi:MAG: MSCRAMM family protein, partial [Thermoplasmatota archaeon]
MKKNMIALLIASILVISSVSFGVTILGTNTEPETTGGIRVTKYNDLNMNEWWDRHDGEEALEGWTIKLYERVDDEWVYFDEKVTDQYGEVYWHDVPVGEYLLEEVMQDHWMNTTSETKEITVVEDQYACHNFGNVQAGSISAWKFHDKNMDGVWTQPCEGVPGWEIEVWRDDKLWYSGETDEEGKVCFDDVPP